MFVRADLPKIQQAVQSSHAAIEVARNGLIEGDSEHPSLVLCSEPSEEKILERAHSFKMAGIRHVVFREPDRHNEVTAVATEPLTKAQRRLLRKSSLLEL